MLEPVSAHTPARAAPRITAALEDPAERMRQGEREAHRLLAECREAGDHTALAAVLAEIEDRDADEAAGLVDVIARAAIGR